MQILKIAEFKVKKEKFKETLLQIHKFAEELEQNPMQTDEYKKLDNASYIHFMVDTQTEIN